MKFFEVIFIVVKQCLHGLNLIKTLKINFRFLDFKSAMKLPVFVYGKLEIVGNGKFVFDCDINTGMVTMGHSVSDVWGRKSYYPGRIENDGTVFFHGSVNIGDGDLLLIRKGACLTFGKRVFCHSRVIIAAEESISIGAFTRISWQSQILDSDFHYMYDIKSRILKNCKRPVIIGKQCWIGNRVSINKGTVLPDYSIVGSYSYVNKDFSVNGIGRTYGGYPAKLLSMNNRRIFNFNLQWKIDDWFVSNESNEELFLDEILANNPDMILY